MPRKLKVSVASVGNVQLMRVWLDGELVIDVVDNAATVTTEVGARTLIKAKGVGAVGASFDLKITHAGETLRDKNYKIHATGWGGARFHV